MELFVACLPNMREATGSVPALDKLDSMVHACHSKTGRWRRVKNSKSFSVVY